MHLLGEGISQITSTGNIIIFEKGVVVHYKFDFFLSVFCKKLLVPEKRGVFGRCCSSL